MTSQWSTLVTNYYGIFDIFKLILKALTFGITEQFTRPLWFIPALFVANISFVIIQLICNLIKNKKLRKILEFIIITVVVIVGYKTHMPRYISNGLSGLYYLYIGYLCRKNTNKINYNMFVSIILTITLVLIAPYSHISMMSNPYPNFLSFLVVPFIGIYVIIYISKLIEKLDNNNIIKK